MNFLRKHWYDLGGFLSIAVFAFLLLDQNNLTQYQQVMWFSLATLFLHQLEEYRVAGTFPGMINTVMYHSSLPDRYPLNTNTAFFINVVVGWTTYFLAALFAEKALWLGLATILVSLGNTIAHTVVFNIRGRSVYNANLLTCWLLFVPCMGLFFLVLFRHHLATPPDVLLGIILGILLNVAGVLKPIEWMADKNTT